MMWTGRIKERQLKITSDFPKCDRSAWLEAAEKALKGADKDEVLVTRTLDDIAIPALATSDDLPRLPRAPARSAPEGSNSGWLVAQSPTHPDPVEANTEILDDLEGGAGAFRLPLDNRSWRATGDDGFNGVIVPDYKALESVLQNIHLDYVKTQLAPGAAYYPFAALFLAAAAGADGTAQKIEGSLGADPLAALARDGALPFSTDDALAQVARLADHAKKNHPGLRATEASSLIYHGAGASEGQELGVLLATGLAYLRAMEKAGLSPSDAAGQISFSLTVGPDMFLGIAKIRALRLAWRHLLSEGGVETNQKNARTNAPIHAEVAPRVYRTKDVWNNLLRATTAAMGAAIGGADSIGIGAHTRALGLPTGNARRVARNIQLLLAEEAYMGAVQDAAGGAYALEKLTGELAAKAWTIFQTIEDAGGMAAVLLSGEIQAMIAKSRTRLLAAIKNGERQIVGVTVYQPKEERSVNLKETPTLPAAAKAQALGIDMDDFEGLIRSARGMSLADMMATLEGDAETVEPLEEICLSEAFEGEGLQ